LVELLLDRGAAVNAGGADFGETALMLAAAENHEGVVTALLRGGAPVDGRSREFTYNKDRFGLEGVVTVLPRGGWTALQYAARNGATEAVSALATAGAQLDFADSDGSTALILAIINGHFETAARLLEHGANANQADSAGMTPLYAAVDMNTLGEIFGRPSRTPTGQLDALQLMRLLLARGASPNATLKGPTLQRAHTPGEPTLNEGATPLMRAAKNGDVAAMSLLLDNGAEVSKAQKSGTTALMFACGLGRGVSAFAKDYGTEADLLAAARLLVARGADVNAVSAAGLTAVHYAAQAADANFPQPTDALLRFMIEQGAKLNVADNQGRTPVDMAMGKGLRGRAGGPVKPREATAQLLRELMTGQ
jgi:ankyrin repeat protein